MADAIYGAATLSAMTTVERRRLFRDGINVRPSLEHGLASWQRVQAAWRARLEEARETHDAAGVAVTEAKLQMCERELARLGRLLQDEGEQL